jgi:hypothetical protein
MPMTPWPADVPTSQTQSFQVALPLLGLGNSDVAVTWPLDFGNSAYAVFPSIEGGALSIGIAIPGLKTGTRTGTACTVTVRNTGLVSIAAGAVLHVIGVG